MKVLLLSDANSSHTTKWVKGLVENGVKIAIFSLTSSEQTIYGDLQVPLLNQHAFAKSISRKSAFLKLLYLWSFKSLKTAIKEFQPDIIHAHYATSYGMLGRLSGFHPFFISVWGSDVVMYPQKNIFHKWILKKNLLSAEQIFSTSKTLYDEVMNVVKQESVIIPFGIDTSKFKPGKSKNVFENDALVIGTIKSLEKIYCIDILIKSFGILHRKYSHLKLRLLIVGSGKEEENLKILVKKLGIKDAVKFTGKIPHQDIVEFHNRIDVFTNLSEYESFGVSVLEASACCKPVVATDTGGLREVVSNHETGILVPVKNVKATVDALEKLILDRTLRIKLGEYGRRRVIEKYEWKNCLEQMIKIYYQYS